MGDKIMHLLVKDHIINPGSLYHSRTVFAPVAEFPPGSKQRLGYATPGHGQPKEYASVEEALSDAWDYAATYGFARSKFRVEA